MSPNTIRAERSEQEVAATAFLPEPGFPYSLRTTGQAGHATRKPHILMAMSPAKSDVRVPSVGLPDSAGANVPFHISQ
ncbi:hypothetical protein [Gimesia sp.]|uniref:hypothetical protein n=1 Tax=Gimesia sp. TaxID=2024833 RepID=UPI0025C471E5|nr:hypothetical protein [Gimesia sp.]